MPRVKTEVGRKPGYRQVTLYVEPKLYERVKHTAYVLQEDVYEFVGEAFANALVRRVSKSQRVAIDSMVDQAERTNNGARREKRR